MCLPKHPDSSLLDLHPSVHDEPHKTPTDKDRPTQIGPKLVISPDEKSISNLLSNYKHRLPWATRAHDAYLPEP